MRNFRKGTEEDILQIAELEASTFSDAWSATSVQGTLKQKQAFITVAEVDGKVVGYCIIYYAMDEAEIARIAISDTARRQGIGRALLDYSCEVCKHEHVGKLLLDVRESNAGAIAFYEQYGFRTDGIRKNFYDFPRENAVLMSYTLA